MHPHVKKGNRIHEMHFKAIASENGYLAGGWDVILRNESIPGSRLRPDWVIINRDKKEGLIIDITSKFRPKHYKKGLTYLNELNKLFDNPEWTFHYIEDYWVDAIYH